MAFIRSRVAGAVLGLVIIGTGGAALAAVTTPPPPPAIGSSALAATSATKTPKTAIASKPTATATSVPISAPTATNPPPPTAIPATPTPAVGQQTTIRGTVATITQSPQSFTVQSSAGTTTIDVNGSTQFSGKATTFSALRTGWQVNVQGIVQADGSVLAVSVDSDN